MADIRQICGGYTADIRLLDLRIYGGHASLLITAGQHKFPVGNFFANVFRGLSRKPGRIKCISFLLNVVRFLSSFVREKTLEKIYHHFQVRPSQLLISHIWPF